MMTTLSDEVLFCIANRTQVVTMYRQDILLRKESFLTRIFQKRVDDILAAHYNEAS